MHSKKEEKLTTKSKICFVKNKQKANRPLNVQFLKTVLCTSSCHNESAKGLKHHRKFYKTVSHTQKKDNNDPLGKNRVKKTDVSMSNSNKDLNTSIDFSTPEPNPIYSVPCAKQVDKLTERKQHFCSEVQERLHAAQFRLLNEKLYTSTGSEAYNFFQKVDPESYSVYHIGYRQQVSKWPVDPLDIIIQSIHKMPLKSSKVIADLGCGEARIAQTFQSTKRTVYSFDLKALSQNVVECDMAQLPLENGSVDVVVLCLSLMGVNLNDYILSASRILKKGGVMKIAEVCSRFQDVAEFLDHLKRFGFQLIKKDSINNYFILMDFKKKAPPSKNNLPNVSLKPCVYKKR